MGYEVDERMRYLSDPGLGALRLISFLGAFRRGTVLIEYWTLGWVYTE